VRETFDAAQCSSAAQAGPGAAATIRPVRYAFALLVTATVGCSSTDATGPDPEPKTPPSAAAQPEPEQPLRRWAFDGAPGSVPTGFDVLETASAGTPATWGVMEDATAPSGDKGFGVLQTANAGQTYNVALAPGFAAADVELTVSVKATTGEQDRGGGVVFRAQGASNYYVARWNPLEGNVRFYVVVNEQRSAFKAADVDLDAAQWHTMRVVVEGERMELFMNDRSVLVAEDDTLGEPGRVGLWTKADAATWFDDFTAQEL